MSLFSDVPFTKHSVYRKDFVWKTTAKRVRAKEQIRDFKDPIAGPYEEHVLPYCKYDPLDKPTSYPEPKEYVRKILEDHPQARRYLVREPFGPPDFKVIDSLYDEENRTIYMCTFCKPGDFDSKQKRKRKTVPLPDGWVIPLTTQQCGYREPSLMAPEGIPSIEIHAPSENLRPNPRVREAQGVTTGLSDYQANISLKGQQFIEGKLHGDARVRRHFDPSDLIKIKLLRRE